MNDLKMLAERIKANVPMLEAALHYGLQVNRQGMACCPFHQEKDPSLKIYAGTRGWHCFGCGEGGDVISFVQKLFGLSFMDAAAKLNEDFSLGLPIGRKLTPMQRVILKKRSERQDAIKQLRFEAIRKAEQEYEDAATWHGFLDRILMRYAPERVKDLNDELLAELDFNPLWATALQLMPAAEYTLERTETRLYEVKHER